MEENFLSQSEFLRAISEGLHTDEETVLLFFIIILGALVLFMVGGRIVRNSEAGKEKKSALKSFNTWVRKLDLTINEIDYLDLLAQFLKKPWKKYLLLTNRKTFTSTLMRLKEQNPDKLRPELSRSISRKAGFEIDSLPVKKDGTRKAYPGAPIRVQGGGGTFFAGEIVRVDDESFEFSTDEAIPPDIEDISVFMIDFSGMNGYLTRISSRKEGNRYTAPHSEQLHSRKWENPGSTGVDTQVYILSHETGEEPVIARLKRLRPGWLVLEDPAKSFRKGQDIRIFLSRKTSGGGWVNGEISRVSRNRQQLMVRLNHVKAV
jgi:hypothetical protein